MKSSTTKKKESIPSPSKASTAPPQPMKKPIAISTTIKPSSKPSVKLEGTSTISKSPSNLPSKQESSPNTNITSSNSTSTPCLISSLKKIPKKVIPPPPPPPPPVVEKRARSPMTPPSSSNRVRHSDTWRCFSSDMLSLVKDSHRHSMKNSKRERPANSTPPSTTVNNSSSGRSSNSSSRSGKHSATSNKGKVDMN